jgi:hypothetical protein
MFADSVIESSATTGTGTYTLSGAVFSGLTFAQGFASGGTVAYFAQTADKSKWEFGYGTLTIGPPRTLTRTIVKSSNAGSAIDWQADDTKYIFSIASADALNSLLAGALATSRPWWLRQGGRWLDYTAGLAVSWIDYLYSGSANVRTGFFDAVKALYFPDNRRPSTAIGAANRTFAAADIGGSFTFSTSGGARTATLPTGSTVADGYHLELKGLSATNGIVLTPQAGDGIDGGADAATKTVPGNVLFTVRWSAADDTWVTSYTAPAATTYPIGTITGLAYSNNGSDATNDIDIAAGGCMDATGAYWMSRAASITKRLDAAWAVGTNQGGLDTGSIANNDYYIWQIARSDTGVVDVLFSTSNTAPTMPSNYDYKRLIGWFKRVSAAIVAFKTWQTAGGGIAFRWIAPTLDINQASTLSTSQQYDAVKVPLTFETDALVRVAMTEASGVFTASVYSPYEDQSVSTPSATAVPLTNIIRDGGGNVGVVELKVRTDSSGRIAAQASLTIDTYCVSTIGFDWERR